MRKSLLLSVFVLVSSMIQAQYPKTDLIRTSAFPKIKEIKNTNIPGAPILSQPQRIDGIDREIRTEEHGLIYPAFYDWNHDGKKDLLLGDFVTGEKGSYIKVFLNEGTDSKPKYSGKYFYATDIKGDTITNYQWCCIGIHPRIIDLDHDGYLDIVSGQYNPGKITWWRGSKDGFLPMQYVEQDGDPNGKYDNMDIDNPHCMEYWVYTSAGFGDFNGDGLPDLFVGGVGGLRVALNTGTKGHPKFGIRQHLLFTDGTPLILNNDEISKEGFTRHIKTYMTPVDWDGDGVLDILLTDEYSMKGDHPIEFFKGVMTTKGLRFNKPVPLFTSADGSDKVFPGCQPMITVADYNNDGVNDIVFGLSIPTINGFEAADSVAWKWIKDLGTEMPGKDAGEVCAAIGKDALMKELDKGEGYRDYYLGKLADYKYLTLRHRGYPFVMYGKKNPVKASRPVVIAAKDPVVQPTKSFSEESPVSYRLNLPDTMKLDGNYKIEVVLTFKNGWHGYTDSKANTALGMIPTTVDVEFPDWIRKEGEISLPYSAYGDNNTLYTGDASFKQMFLYEKYDYKVENGKTVRVERINTTGIPVKIKISYQVCNDKMCLPPEEHIINVVIPIKNK